jgi:uncharacterized membrane protein YjjB (DUF3815 family)
VVYAIGDFAVGFLWNVYSRQFGGAAFTAMVAGVVFLVPTEVRTTHSTSCGAAWAFQAGEVSASGLRQRY